MTEKEFNDILLAANAFQWQQTGTGGVVRAKHLNGNIYKDDALIEWWTPVTAVCYMHTQVEFHPADDWEAAMVLQLAPDIARKVIHSSDFPHSKEVPMVE